MTKLAEQKCGWECESTYIPKKIIRDKCVKWKRIPYSDKGDYHMPYRAFYSICPVCNKPNPYDPFPDKEEVEEDE